MLRRLHILSAASILFALALYIDLHPYLRGGFGWRWFHEPAPILRTLALTAAVIAYIAGAYALLRWTRRGVWALVWALAGSVVLALGVTWLKQPNIGYELFIRTASMVATGPHHAAAALDLKAETLRDWTSLAQNFDPETESVSRHVVQSPPGLPLLYEGVTNALAQFPALARQMALPLMLYQCHNYALLAYSNAEWASAWVGMLMPLWAALTVFPVYGVARRLDVPAREAALWWALVPVAAAFAGSWNTVYPLLAVTAFYVFVVGLHAECGGLQHETGGDRALPCPRPLPIAGAGVIVGVLTFLNFAPVPVVGVFGFYTLLHMFTHPRMAQYPPARRLQRAVIVGVWFGAGLLAPWLAWMRFGGESPLAMLSASFGIHLGLERPYAPWVFLHTYDWVLFAGLPLALASLLLLRRPNTGARRLAWALWLSVLVLAVSGMARGETARVWSFFTPFVLIAAAGLVRDNRGGWTALTAAHAAMFLALTSTWIVFGAEEMPPPAEKEMFARAVFGGAPVQFGASITLVSWDGHYNSTPDGDSVVVWLNWQAAQRMTTPYWFAALLVAPDGAPVGEAVIWQGQQTNYPTTCWQPGEQVVDPFSVPLPAAAPPGDYWLSLAVFADEARPQDRLPVMLPDGTTDTQVGLGPITVP